MYRGSKARNAKPRSPRRRGNPIESLEPRLLLAADLVINEFMASNRATLADSDGHFSDWIEIANRGDTAANLLGLFLTDNSNNLDKWEFPSQTLNPGQQLVVFASSKDRAVAGQQLHTDFSLDANGGYLALVHSDGTTVLSSYAYSRQQNDISYGYDPASPGGWTRRLFANPTPGLANQRSELVINEIHYDPDVKTELVEFVEVHNPGTRAVNLGGATISSGVSYTFPAGTTLAAGGYLLIAGNPTQFQAKFGKTALGPWVGGLSNEGETIRVENATGGTLDEVDYDGGFPWPTVGEAPGNSIELINPDFDNAVGGNWRSSTPVVATPYTVINSGQQWRYRKGTSEASSPVTAWREIGFTEDGTWLTGTAPIGYDPSQAMGTTLTDMRQTTNPVNAGYASVFFRKTFAIANPSQIASLNLEAFHDDGINVWINGRHVLRNRLSADEMTYNATASSNATDPAVFVSYLLGPDAPSTYLVAGTNVITVQLHNISIKDSSDAFFDGRLIATPAGSLGPTPGLANSKFATNAAPQMRQVSHSPQQPTAGQVVTITAKITDPEGVQSASLSYQLVDPGSYINLTDAAYATTWTSVPMYDNGSNGDVLAGDGIYTVQLPANLQVHRRLVRYRVTATDTLGASITAPYADDPTPNFAYFVYNGVPGWSGAAQPGVTSTVNYSASLMNEIPAYHLISKKTDVEGSTWTDRTHGDEYFWRGTLVYDGIVYDHISYRPRGGVWRYAMGKNMWKFDFNSNHEFQAKDDYGRAYDTTWSKLNLSAIIQQGDYWHRGEQGLFESVGFRLFNLAGLEASRTNYVQFRIIDEAAETGATQYDGDLWGLYLAVEQLDGNFLDEHDLPDGNLYKMESGTGPGGGVLNNQGPTQVTNNSDLVAFTGAYSNSAALTDQWWRDNLDLERYYNYRSIVEAIHHGDIGYGKNYFYYNNPETNKWQVYAWDLDLTWADNMYGNGEEPFKSRVVASTNPPRPDLTLEYQNRLREIRDLLYNSEQTGWIIDEYARFVYTPGQPSWVDVDRSMWDYNPVMANSSIVNLNKAGQGRFYAGGGGQVIPSPGGFAGMMNKMKNYVATRSNLIDTTLISDSLIPAKPSITRLGTATYPVDDLRFRTTSFNDATGAFAGMQWRIAEITNPGAPGFDASLPMKYEIETTWQSPVLTTFNSDIQIPADAVEAGKRYRIRVKMLDSTGRWSNWSAPIEFVATPSPSLVKDNLRITEINYHPQVPPVGSPFVKDDFEFIELTNMGTSAINLNGAKFTNGVDFTFGDITLAGGQSVVVMANQAAFASRYSTLGVVLAGEFQNDTGLDNSGERIVLEDALGQTILDFSYFDDEPDWQPSTDGAGKTLVIVDPLAATSTWGTASSWRASLYNDGTPGAFENTLPAGSVIVSEALTNSDTGGDWIELYNTSNQPIDLSGWFLSDSKATRTKYQIQPGTSIGAGQYLVLYELTQFGAAAAAGALEPFALNQDGDDVILSSATLAGVLTGYDHEVHFEASAPLLTFGHYTTPSNTNDFVALATGTPGDPNGTPVVGPVVINEIMYNPSAGGDEYIELRNITNQSVQLFDPANPGNGWKLTDGVDFTFLQGDLLDPFAYGLVVGIAPAAFRAKYSIPASVKIFGPWTGVLDNGGEGVTLSRPAPPAIDLSIPYITVDRIVYDDAVPWPTTPDGTGPSLGRRISTLYGNDSGNWQAELAGGSPGAYNLDVVAPTLAIGAVSPDPRTTGVDSITFTFSEAVQGFTLADLVLSRDGGPNLLTGAQSLTSSDMTAWTLAGLSGITWLKGTYTLTLASGHGITDLGGLALSSNPTESFIVQSSTLSGSSTDTWTIRRNGTNLDIFHNIPVGPTPTFVAPLASVGRLTLDGGAGDDTVVLDWSAGDPTPPQGLEFIGGAGDDSIAFTGLDGLGVTYLPSALVDGAAIVQVDTTSIEVTAEEVQLIGADSAAIVTPNISDVLQISSPQYGSSLVTGSSGGTPLPALRLEDVGTLILDLNSSDNGSGADSVTITGSALPGFDTLALLRSNGSTQVHVTNAPMSIDLAGPGSLNLLVDGSAVIELPGSLDFADLQIKDTAEVNLAAAAVTRVGSLAIDTGASLDLRDGDLILETNSEDQDAALTTVGQWIADGQIMSSTAQGNPLHTTGLAAMVNNDGTATPLMSTFSGQSVSPYVVLVKYTYIGDADLNGVVDIDDYFRIDVGYARSRLGYRNGDFNYSGTITADDYFLIDRSALLQGGVLSGDRAGQVTWPFASKPENPDKVWS